MRTSCRIFVVAFCWSALTSMSDAFVAGAASSSPSNSKAASANGDENLLEPQKECRAGETSGNNEESTTPGSTLPQLPAGDPNDKTVPVLKLGESIKFDEMGPVIINTDGTTRQIANWDKMTEHEKTLTWRRISKRNAERRAMLEEKMRAEMGDSGEMGEDGEK